MALHKNLTLPDIHICHAFTYANAGLRTGATGMTSADLGKIAWQTDNNSFWALVAITPTWVELTEITSVPAHAASHQNGGGDEVATVTAGANAIPKAGAGGKLDVGWVPLGSSGSTVCVGNDARLSDGRTDSNALHKATSAEISALTEKTTPVSADVLVIEDSAASYAKKKVQIANLGTSFDMRDIVAFDHFVTATSTSERIGQMNWLALIGGTGSDMVQAGVAGHPGVVDISPGTTATGRAAIYLGDTTYLNMLLGTTQPQIDLEWLVKFDANALISTSNERFFMGFGDTFDVAAGTEMTNGVYLGFNPSLTGNFDLVTAAAGVRTRTASGIAVVASTWYRIGIRITYPGGVPTAELLINGTVRATATANFPSAALGIGARMDANTNSAKPRYQLDYMQLKQITSKET
jgi:hypothetical protein